MSNTGCCPSPVSLGALSCRRRRPCAAFPFAVFEWPCLHPPSRSGSLNVDRPGTLGTAARPISIFGLRPCSPRRRRLPVGSPDNHAQVWASASAVLACPFMDTCLLTVAEVLTATVDDRGELRTRVGSPSFCVDTPCGF